MILEIGEFVKKINDYSHKVKPYALFLQNICVLSTIRLLDSNEILQQHIKSYTNKISDIVNTNIDKFILYVSDTVLRIYAQQVDLSYSDCDSIENNVFDVTSLNALEKNIYIIITTFIYNYIVKNISILETKFNSLFETTDSQPENLSQKLNESNELNDETESEKLLQKINESNIINELKLLYKIYYVLMTNRDIMTDLLHDVFEASLDTFYNKILPSNIVNINIDKIFIPNSILVSFKFKIDYLGNAFDRNNIVTEFKNMFNNENKASRQSTKPKSSIFNDRRRATDFDTYNQFFDMDHVSVMNRYCVNCSDCSSCLCCYNCSKCFMCSYCTFTKKSTMSMFVNRSTHINHCYGVDNGTVNQYCNNVESCENCTRLNNAKKCYNVRDSACLDNIESYKHVYGTIDNYLTFDDIHDSNIYTNSNMLIEDDGKTIKSATKLSISEYDDLKRSSMIERRICLV